MDQSQLEELGKQMRAFQPEIVIKGREDPSDILRQVLVLWPGLLYYLKQYRVWTGPFQSRVQLAYRNREYPWRQVLAPEAAEVEEELRRCVMRYQKKSRPGAAQKRQHDLDPPVLYESDGLVLPEYQKLCRVLLGLSGYPLYGL